MKLHFNEKHCTNSLVMMYIFVSVFVTICVIIKHFPDSVFSIIYNFCRP
jgi:hypothetical protein